MSEENMEKTKVDINTHLSQKIGVQLHVKHDDTFPLFCGGSKARKIIPILKDAENKDCNAIVTAGAANSNHARVTALAAADKGWRCTIVIHDIEDYTKGNLVLMRLAGAELRFVEMQDVAQAMNKAMDDLSAQGFSPYYIYGGGHTLHGMLAYYDAVAEFEAQGEDWVPDYVVHASGTGGTQSGLVVGFSQYYPDTKVLGISVARDKKRGADVVYKGAVEVASHLNLPQINRDQINFFDEWVGGGYGSTYPRLMQVIKLAGKTGLITDPTYTGKALTALFDMVEEGTIEQGSKVLFWHTGGIFNLFNYHKELDE